MTLLYNKQMKKTFNVVKIYPLTFDLSIKQDYDFRWAWVKKNSPAKKTSKKVSRKFKASNYTDIKKLTHVFALKAETTKDDFQTEILLLVINNNKVKIAGRVNFNVYFFADSEGQFRQKFFLSNCPDKNAHVIFGIDVKLVPESETLSFDNSISSISDTFKNISNISMMSVDSNPSEARFQPLVTHPPIKHILLDKPQKYVDDLKLSPISKSLDRTERKGRSEPDSPVMDVSASFGSRRHVPGLDNKPSNDVMHNFSFGHIGKFAMKKTDSIDANNRDDLDFDMSLSYKPLKEGQDDDKYLEEIKKLKNTLREMTDIKKENSLLKEKLSSSELRAQRAEDALEKARKEIDMLKLQRKIRESMDQSDHELYKLQNRLLDLQEINENIEAEVG